jgi:CubicO group peptidase (beta-lactamase class C family)
VSVADAHQVIERAIAARVFSVAAFEVGSADGFISNEALGALAFDALAQPAPRDTIFDLASLTKPIATTSVAMALVASGALALDALVADSFAEWRGADRERVAVRDLLEHASGLPARLVDQPPHSRREFEHDICTIALEYAPRTKSVYSDLGFILLGFLAEDRGGAPLDALFDRITVRLKPDTTEGQGREPRDFVGGRTEADDGSGSVRLQAEILTFGLSAAARHLAAPTRPMAEDARRGRTLVGEVHDNYAAALGGVAGHAGLFGTANGVGAFARAILRALRGDTAVPPPFSRDLVRQFIAKGTVPGSSRALGWDTMLPTSSCGTRMSASAFGHVGFTGTSLWIDPARDRYFVLLTNRVFGGGTLEEIRTVRRAFHDALGDV